MLVVLPLRGVEQLILVSQGEGGCSVGVGAVVADGRVRPSEPPALRRPWLISPSARRGPVRVGSPWARGGARAARARYPASTT